jgi:hypothetical protein
MNITVRIKNVYGEDKVYPVCNAAKTFAELAGTTTLTARAVSLIKQLGYTINVEAQTL